jgi:hypothetical protein
MVQPHASPRCEPTLEAERILMVDFTSTQAQGKEVAPPISHERGQAKDAVVKPSSSPPMGWTRCNANKRRFTPSPPRN